MSKMDTDKKHSNIIYDFLSGVAAIVMAPIWIPLMFAYMIVVIVAGIGIYTRESLS